MLVEVAAVGYPGGDGDVQVRPPVGLDVVGEGDPAEAEVDSLAAFNGAFGAVGGLRVERVPIER
jgi:hypothetical protein